MDLIDNLCKTLYKTCENCKYRGTSPNNYPCCDCLIYEQDNGNLTGSVTFTKFCQIDATCIPTKYKNNKIHRYLDKLKEEGLITGYDIKSIYMDGKPYCTDIWLCRGKYVYTQTFNHISDQNFVITSLAECMIELYREMANDLMKKIKEDK